MKVLKFFLILFAVITVMIIFSPADTKKVQELKGKKLTLDKTENGRENRSTPKFKISGKLPPFLNIEYLLSYKANSSAEHCQKHSYLTGGNVKFREKRKGVINSNQGKFQLLEPLTVYSKKYQECDFRLEKVIFDVHVKNNPDINRQQIIFSVSKVMPAEKAYYPERKVKQVSDFSCYHKSSKMTDKIADFLRCSSDYTSSVSVLWTLEQDLIEGITFNFEVPDTDSFPERVIVSQEAKGLILSIKKNKVRDVKKALNKGVSANVTDENLKSALHYAAGRGNLEIIEALIEKGANVNASDEIGKRPLAYSGTKIEVIKLLLKHGADINDHGEKGSYTLRNARNDLPLTKFLVEQGASLKTEFLLCHVIGGSPEVLSYLVEQGADVNAAYASKGMAPLHCSARNGKAINKLIELGADLEQRDFEGKTPVFYANKDTVEAFVNAGADINAESKLGDSPIFNVRDIDEFIYAGANVQHRNRFGVTPIIKHLSIRMSLPVVQSYIRKGIDFRHKVSTKELNEYLVLIGKSPIETDIELLTPYDLALMRYEEYQSGRTTEKRDEDFDTVLRLLKI